jgi:hypothetical protein
MRGVKAKAARKLARVLLIRAVQEGHEEFAQEDYIQNSRTGQILTSGYRGIYRRLKKMYRENMEVPI